jgi:Zn-dependent protease with chaperone function
LAIANLLQLSFLFGGSDEEHSRLGLIGVLATITFAPLAAMLLQLGVSRQREYLADATGAELLGARRRWPTPWPASSAAPGSPRMALSSMTGRAAASARRPPPQAAGGTTRSTRSSPSPGVPRPSRLLVSR